MLLRPDYLQIAEKYPVEVQFNCLCHDIIKDKNDLYAHWERGCFDDWQYNDYTNDINTLVKRVEKLENALTRLAAKVDIHFQMDDGK